MEDENDEVRLTLRLPAKLRDRILGKASESGRSLNAEIIMQLEAAVEGHGKALAQYYEHQASLMTESFHRLQGVFDRQTSMFDVMKFSLARANTNTFHQAAIIEALCHLILESGSHPTPGLREMAERLLKISQHTRARFADFDGEGDFRIHYDDIMKMVK